MARKCEPKTKHKYPGKQKRENAKRLKELNKMADELQKKSGSKTKTVKITKYNLSRTEALKKAGREYRKKNSKFFK